MPGDPNAVTFYAQRLKARYDIPGVAFFVNNSTVLAPGAVAGADVAGVGESELQPLATIDFAIGRCVAGRGDAIFVMGPHSETVTSSITLDVAGVQIIGLKIGNKSPVVTINGATDLFTITAANCRISGLEMTIVTTDAATALVNVAAAKARLDNIKMIPSATSVNVVDCITLASGANDCLIEDVDIRNTTVAVVSFLSIEAAVARLTVRRFRAFGDTTTGGIIDGATATQLLLEDVTVGTVGTTQPAATLDSNPTGLVIRSNFAGTSTTLANNGALGTGVRMFDVKVLEETNGSAQGALIPAVDAD